MTATVDADLVEAFQERYPEFTTGDVITDSRIKAELADALMECGAKRWGSWSIDPPSLRSRGVFAYAAHRLALATGVARAVEAGGVPSGPAQVSSRSVADESLSYAVPTPTSAEATTLGDFRTTIYGVEFLRLRKRAGMGAATTGQVRMGPRSRRRSLV